MMQYNTGEVDYENTILDDAYELLEEAEHAKTKKQAIKLVKEAYELCPDCFDAILFQVDLEDNSLKREKLLNEGLEFERERLEDKKYFTKIILEISMYFLKQDLILEFCIVKHHIII